MVFDKLKNMVLGGAGAIKENKEQLNKMNVFPIPDGDTGTNMERTIMGAVKMYAAMGAREACEDDFDELYRSVLMASQGNSGVILSQWFKGFLASMKYADEISSASLNEAFLYAIEGAYAAVINPVEGTFLTVAREAQEMAEEDLDEEMATEEYLRNFLEAAKKSLAETPEKLQVLKDAGVVDSGGMGFVYFISGMLSALDGSFTPDMEMFDEISGTAQGSLQVDSNVQLDEFGYCTELILQISDDKADEYSLNDSIEFLNEIGGSVVAIRDKNQVKIHVHTLIPEDVLKHFHAYGEFIKLKIENMSVQHNELNREIKSEKAVVAVVNGSEIAKTLKGMGVGNVLDRRADSELSVGEISNAIKAANAENVILLLDDKNLHLLSIGIKEVCKGINIHVINGSSASDEHAAMSVFNMEDSFDILEKTMEEAVKNNTVCIVKRSDEISDYNDLDIKPGDYIASVNGTYTENFDDLSNVIEAMLQNVENAAEMKSVAVFCCDDEAQLALEELKMLFEKHCPSAEICILKGGQEENMYMISIR